MATVLQVEQTTRSSYDAHHEKWHSLASGTLRTNRRPSGSFVYLAPGAAASIPSPPWLDQNGHGQSRSVKRVKLQSGGATCKLISMPELPDITVYIAALEARIIAQPIERVRLAS